MASSAQAAATVAEPFPIFTVAHKYILYDVDTVSHARAKHNITGVLIGGLPQAPQQNVFSGIPLELMPEEARLLVEKGVAYLVDDVKAHKDNMLGNGLAPEERRAFQNALRKQGSAAAKDAERKMEERKKGALEKKFGSSDWNDIPEDMLLSAGKRNAKKGKRAGSRTPVAQSGAASGAATPAEEVESLFASTSISAPPAGPPRSGPPTPAVATSSEPSPWAVTPTTSTPPLNPIPPPPQEALPLPGVPSSYPLFKHLHEKSYFMSPGLRFGCQYTAYPGDPLRFHSHFLCSGMAWEEEFDLLDIVGGGRLGTGVKKGYLIGGQEVDETNEDKGVGIFPLLNGCHMQTWLPGCLASAPRTNAAFRLAVLVAALTLPTLSTTLSTNTTNNTNGPTMDLRDFRPLPGVESAATLRTTTTATTTTLPVQQGAPPAIPARNSSSSSTLPQRSATTSSFPPPPSHPRLEDHRERFALSWHEAIETRRQELLGGEEERASAATINSLIPAPLGLRRSASARTRNFSRPLRPQRSQSLNLGSVAERGETPPGAPVAAQPNNNAAEIEREYTAEEEAAIKAIIEEAVDERMRRIARRAAEAKARERACCIKCGSFRKTLARNPLCCVESLDKGQSCYKCWSEALAAAVDDEEEYEDWLPCIICGRELLRLDTARLAGVRTLFKFGLRKAADKVRERFAAGDKE